MIITRESSINPPFDTWQDGVLPILCREKIIEICEDILKRGANTRYDAIYDYLYQRAEDEVEEEKEHAYYE